MIGVSCPEKFCDDYYNCCKCLLYNARSIVNKVDLLPLIITDYNPQMIFVTESWLTDRLPSAYLGVQPHYSVLRKDRTDSVGGGVCVLLKRDLQYCQIDVMDNVGDIDVLVFDVKLSLSRIRFILCYRPPQRSQEAADGFVNLLKIVEKCSQIAWPVVLLGDFNLPGIDWINVGAQEHLFHKSFVNCIVNNGYTQYVQSPTRNGNILDLVLCSHQFVISDCVTVSPIGTSDHAGVLFRIFDDSFSVSDTKSGFLAPPVITDYDYSRADYNAMNQYLNNIDWYSYLANIHDIQSMWDTFIDIVYGAIDMFVPTRTYKLNSRTNVGSYPKYIRRLFKRKLVAWRRYKRFGSEQLKRQYIECSSKCQVELDSFIKARELKLIDSGNLGSFYKYINNRTVARSGVAPLVSSEGELVYDDCGKAELLNAYFGSVFTDDDNLISCTSNVFSEANVEKNKLSDIDFGIDQVLRILSKLKSKKSRGPDGLSAEFLRNVSTSIAYPLTFIFNQSFCNARLPQIWKQAHVTPVFKKGASSDPNNYRPISLTCICCKIMETIIKDQTLTYLRKTNKISKQQHGFLARHSTCSQLIEAVNDWTIGLNSKSSVDVVYIDFKKAFDSVVHSKLLYKLSCVGICGRLLLWIADFLSQRSQAVIIGDSLSSNIGVKSGVPQGSVLGPLLFIIYINDLSNCFGDNVSMKLFADDAKIYMVVDNIQDYEVLQDGLQSLARWAAKWQLLIAIPKCSVLHIGNKNACYSYNINGTLLPNVMTALDLGVTVDAKLSFTQHIACVVSKAHQRAGLILRCFKSRDRNLLFKAFCVYVRPILEYCTPVWSPSYSGEIEKIEQVQRRFTKRLSGLKYLLYKERLDALKAESLELRRLKADLTTVYKIWHGHIETSMHNLFSPVNSVTRGHRFKLEKPLTRVNCRLHSFACRTVNCWNFLPSEVVDAATVSAFRRRLDKVNFSRFVHNF